jgi:WD40 repeat protein
MRRLASLLLLPCLALPLAAADDAAVARLIRQLGSEEFAEREAAAKELVALGEAAWPALRKAAVDHPDPEVRKAAADARDRIADNLFGALRTFEGHEGQVNCVAVTPDGKHVLTGGLDATLRLWDAGTGKEVWRKTEKPGGIWCVAVSPDGKYAVSSLGMHEAGGWVAGRDHAVRLWDLATGKLVRTFEGHTDELRGLAFSPDGKFVLSGAFDKTARLWVVETGKEARRFVGHERALRQVALSPDGKRALTSSLDGTARVWDVANGKEICRFEDHNADVLAVAFTPDSRFAVSGGADMTARLWDAATGKEVRRFTGHTSVVFHLAVSPNGRSLLTAGGLRSVREGSYAPCGEDQEVRLWDLASGAEVHRFGGHSSSVVGVCFGPDGKAAFSCGSDRTARMWKVAALRP